jgi:hypothetical protein
LIENGEEYYGHQITPKIRKEDAGGGGAD